MLNKTINFALHNRIMILVMILFLLSGGSYYVLKSDIDVFPDLNAPTVVVMTEAPGYAPEEIERTVTFPIETVMNGATGVRRVRSSSSTGFSVVWVEFDWGTDIYLDRQIVSEKLLSVSSQFPNGVKEPVLGPQSSILGEMLIVGLTADSTSLDNLRTIADRTIRPRLLSLGGIAEVQVIGGGIKEYQILLDLDRMKHYNVSIEEVEKAATGVNNNVGGGILYEYGNEYIIKGNINTTSLTDIANTVVRSDERGTVLLSDIANVQLGTKSPKLGLASENAKPAVLLTVTKQPKADTNTITDNVVAALDDMKNTLPKDLKISTDTFRQSDFINSSIGNIRRSLIEGGICVAIVLFIFLMNMRTTFISLMALPLSVIVAIIILHLFDYTINTMILGGLAIAIGSLVDDAIVDVENVHKRLLENKQLPPEKRKSVLHVVYEASKEVRMPIFNSSLIIIASFTPLFFLSGMEGRLLIPLGIAFIVALMASTFVALTVTPVLCSILLGNPKESDKESRIMLKMKAAYLRLLNIAFAHKKAILSTTGALLVVALVVLCTLGRSFLPPFNEGSFTINVSTLPGISLEESDSIGRRAERALLAIPEIKVVGRKTGRAELDEHALGVNTSEIEAPFELSDRTKDELLADVRHRLSEIPGINVEVGSPISHRIDAMLSGTRAGIAIKLFGTDLNRMYALGNQIRESIEDVEGIADLNVEQQVERPQLKIVPRPEMLAMYGVTMPQFTSKIEALLQGVTVSQVYDGNSTFDLTLKVSDDKRGSMSSIRDLMVDTPSGKVTLSQLADITSSSGPNTVSRENVQRKIVISANVSGRDLLGVVNDIRDIVGEKIHLPEGYHIEYGGQFESERTASRTLLVASLISLIVIFVLLFHQFRNLTQSAVVMLNLPLAIIGGVMSIAFTTGVISIPAIIGFISLFGIATRNGMLLISRYNDLRRRDYSIKDSILQGSVDRLNPILMTALTSALALIPMVFGGDLPGNEIQSPMAKVILGGLISSTVLNIFIIPVVYQLVSARK